MFKTRNGKEIYEVNTTGEILNWWFVDMNTGEEFFVKTVSEEEAFRVARANGREVKGFGSICDHEAERMGLPYVA